MKKEFFRAALLIGVTVIVLAASSCAPTDEDPGTGSYCEEDADCGDTAIYFCDTANNECKVKAGVDIDQEGTADTDEGGVTDQEDAEYDPTADDGTETPDIDQSGCDYTVCNGNGKCQPDNSCKCYQGYAGTYCDECSPGYIGYPDCYFKMCEPNTRTCKDDLTIQQCDEKGMDWTEVETCSGEATCFKGECLTECGRAEAEESYVGCEYWGAFLQNLMEYDGGNYAVVVANPNDTDVTVTVYISGDTQIAQFSVAPGQINSYTFDQSYLIPGPGVSNLAFKFVSSRPVTMTQMNPFGNVLIYTNDATLLLPKGALGLKNMAMSWPTWKESHPGYISVIATEPGTTALTVIYGGASDAGTGVVAQNPGDSVAYTIDQYQILTLNSAPGGNYGADLSGTYISADKKIAVFGGHRCTNVPADTAACDHLEHQMFPLRSWGKDYVVVRTRPRGTENDNIRFLASEDNTTINWTGGLSGTVVLNAGQRHDIWTTTDFTVSADKPIMVGQILASQDAGAGTGDPAMMLIAPNEQMRNDYIFLVAPNYDYDRLTIVSQANNQITLDGTVMDSNTFVPIPGTPWLRQYVDTNDGAHTLTSTGPVALYVYGFSQYVSYAYTAGLDLLKINDQD